MSVNFMEKRDQFVEGHIKEKIGFEINDEVKELLTNYEKIEHHLSVLDEMLENVFQSEDEDLQSIIDDFVSLKEEIQNKIYIELCMSLSFQ